MNQNDDFYPRRPVLNFNGKNYKFTNFQLLIFIVCTPLLSFFTYYFLKLKINYWIYETISLQVSFFLNTIFNMNTSVIFYSDHNTFPTILIPNHPFEGTYAITTNCIAAHIFSILIGLILFIPSSKELSSKKNFILRKLKTLLISVIGIHLLNLIRLVFLLFFNFKGIPFNIIHESLFYLSAIIGALFVVIILKNWMPELFISFYYIYRLVSQKIRTFSFNSRKTITNHKRV